MTELLFKVIIIGDATVGKTSFVQRYVHSHPRREYKPTVGGTKGISLCLYFSTKYFYSVSMTVTEITTRAYSCPGIRTL